MNIPKKSLINQTRVRQRSSLSWGSSKLLKHANRTASNSSLSSTIAQEKCHSEAELVGADFWHLLAEWWDFASYSID